MANNCLIKKYKVAVNNDNILKYGEFRIGLSGNRFIYQFSVTDSAQVSILNSYPNVVFTENNQRTFNLDTALRHVTPSDDCVISLDNKYKIVNLIANANTNVACDIDQLQYISSLEGLSLYSGLDGNVGDIVGHTSKLSPSIQNLALYSKRIIYDGLPVMPALKDYGLKINEAIDINEIVNKCANLERIFAFYADVKGNIETLPARTGLTTLRLEQRGANPHNVTGDIVSLASWSGLTTLNISGTKISGSIAAFLDAMYNAGRTSGSITITVNNIVTNVSGASSTQTYNFSSGGWTMA